jgi:tRNA dimethylallyltransferase
MDSGKVNCIAVLGPTASGKTQLGVRLAHGLGGEVVSADSRQVYRGLDLGTGKDLHEYVVDGEAVGYHLIDILDLPQEFNLYNYQQRCYDVFEQIRARGVMPVIVGGTGLYLDAVLKGYRMVEAPEDPAFHAELAAWTTEQLEARLRAVQPKLHNTTDLVEKERLIRAIEIAEAARRLEPRPAPDIRPFIIGTCWERDALRERIRARLRERFEAGMTAEVAGLHEQGVTWERLERLGLEYRHIALYLQGKTRNRNDMFQKLYSDICQFAKRQETWFRRMERQGMRIHWVDRAAFAPAWNMVSMALRDGS